jgi:RNA polymerase sigma-70 factor (ECF subfamily)
VRWRQFTPAGDQDVAGTRSSLLERLQDWNDHQGWQDFFDTYWKLIYAVALKSGLSDAEAHDVVQETVVAVAKQMRVGGYDRTKSSFKNWLCLITRRRIVDHLRRRESAAVTLPGRAPEDSTHTDALARVADPASIDLNELWEAEWQKNLIDAAIERVKHEIGAKQFQMFDLYVLKNLPLREVTRTLHVSATLVYVTKHRISALVKREVKRLEKEMNERKPV